MAASCLARAATSAALLSIPSSRARARAWKATRSAARTYPNGHGTEVQRDMHSHVCALRVQELMSTKCYMDWPKPISHPIRVPEREHSNNIGS